MRSYALNTCFVGVHVAIEANGEDGAAHVDVLPIRGGLCSRPHCSARAKFHAPGMAIEGME